MASVDDDASDEEKVDESEPSAEKKNVFTGKSLDEPDLDKPDAGLLAAFGYGVALGAPIVAGAVWAYQSGVPMPW